MEAYLDNSATTVCEPEVVEIMNQVFLKDYGNPSSMHNKGMEAEQYVKDAKEKIAKTIKAQPKEILFTSGGTESNNLAIIGSALANKRAGNRVITTAVEHPSAANPMKYLEELGFEVITLPVDEKGVISLTDLQEAMTTDTILVSMMYVNNEIGSVMPVLEAAELVKKVNKNTVFHIDAIQAYGKYEIDVRKLKVDLISASGHKIHGPKGIGFLYMRDKVKVKPLMLGGGQQGGMRSGTDNVPGIAGLAEAATIAYTDFKSKLEHLRELRNLFIEQVSQLDGTHVNGSLDDTAAPHIVSVSFPGIRSEVLLHSLEEYGIYVSAGSACASNKPAVSPTLTAIKVKQEYLDSTIRFSFSVHTTSEEIVYAIEKLKEIVPRLQKYIRH